MRRRDRRAPSAAGSTRLVRSRRYALRFASGGPLPLGPCPRFQDERALRAEGPRQVVEALQAEAFEELPCRPVQDGATGGLFATALLDESPRRERIEGLVAVHPADRLDLRAGDRLRSEEHTSELQSLAYLVCRLLLEKK